MRLTGKHSLERTGSSLLSFIMGLLFSCFLPGDVCTPATIQSLILLKFCSSFEASRYILAQLQVTLGTLAMAGYLVPICYQLIVLISCFKSV